MNEERLIELVQENPVLYNKKISGYKNINLKSQVWKKIAEELNQTGE